LIVAILSHSLRPGQDKKVFCADLRAGWQTDLASGKELLGLFADLYDVSTRWVVTHRIALWSDEIAWMSLYFSVAVWTGMALCGFVLVKDRLPQYLVTAVWTPRLMARLFAVASTDAIQSSAAGRNRMCRMD
jgi:hypothetical protein